MSNIAVLITCHNRREGTLNCLKALFKTMLPEDYKLSVFLVDDGSTDGTSETTKEQFPVVNIIYGNGNLYWNQGMRLAWKTAAQSNQFDFYLWLNDDTLLDKHAITELLECYNESIKLNQTPSIIVGACRNSIDKNEFSYGGRTEEGPVIPNGKLQESKYINGNVVLVPYVIFLKTGNLSNEYTHTMGDFDYGLRASNAGFKCYTTRTYIAICAINQGIPDWHNPIVPLGRRLKLLHSPKGLNLREYIIFRRKFWGNKVIIFTLKAYLKAIFPKTYNKLTN